ncbi:hypothetical protein ABBQ32_009604 [Trebouxia sp. C0010 RCD-2024]
MTQVQTIGGLKRGRGRGRGRGTGRGRGGRSGRSEKPQPFEPFKGSAKSLTADSNSLQPAVSHGSGVFAAEQQHLAGVARLQQQHDEAIALRAVEMAELARQQQAQPTQASCSSRSRAPGTFAPDPPQPPATSSASSDIIDLCDETDQAPQQASRHPARPPAKPREQISWSLGVGGITAGSSAPSGSRNTDNPFWAPARYMPAGGESQPDLRLQTHEVVQVLDSGLVGHRGAAVLDTGNAGCTLITKSFARQLGLVDMHGNPTQAYSRTIKVQGVVAGAFELIKTLNITYDIKGKRMHIVAGLTDARLGCDLLISRREIAEFESDGYRLSAR